MEGPMGSRLALLLLLGLWLDPEMQVKAATFIDTTPLFWIKPESPSTPWANVTLQCLTSYIVPEEFQLLKDGEVFSSHPAAPYASFSLGPVTAENRGIYRCRIQEKGNSWDFLSAPVEVTGTEPLPAPSLWAEPGPWILHGLETKLHCKGELLGMTFDLYQEGEQEPMNSSHPQEPEATFIIRNPGNYTCRYRPPTTAPGVTSAPSMINVVIPDSLPKPSLRSGDNLVVRPGGSVTFTCWAGFPLLEFKLFKDGEEVFVPLISSSNPEAVNFHLLDLEPGAGGKYSCRYRFQDGPQIWSEDSESLELVLSTEILPKPSLSVQPPDAVISRGTKVTLRCQGSRPNMRFALLKKGSNQPEQVLSPPGDHADFVLSDATAAHSGNYSCIYFETVPLFAGSLRSENVEVQVDGLLPKPTLRALRPTAPLGRDAVLRCVGSVPHASFQLFREGESRALAVAPRVVGELAVDFVLKNFGARDAGRYRCRYTAQGEPRRASDMSEPARVSVAGEPALGLGSRGASAAPRRGALDHKSGPL
ncbi:venom metalloproteinase inhibitor DM43-like [Macrotis lagotis]|uniref:venom metalloproteinase inhibitor DM43-like n=1 Tax=Macrotis lagotis TaxID=92651 RepID=UPI003D692F3E